MNGNDVRDAFGVASEEYEPCNPDSQPNQELSDWIKEPVEQWMLENEPIEADTYRDARHVWLNLGEQAIPRMDSDGMKPEGMKPKYVRQLAPATAKQYAEKLKPMIFESVGLSIIPLELLAQVESDSVIIGQMFGVPRDGGYVPVLVLSTTITGGRDHCIDHMHQMFHLLNDVFSEDPEEVQVIF